MKRIALLFALLNGALIWLTVRWALNQVARGLSVFDSGFFMSAAYLIVEAGSAALLVHYARKREERKDDAPMARPWTPDDIRARMAKLSIRAERKRAQ